ncbi:transporter [Serratia sp. S1B]|nr:transporter [Serratia sp. S1B]
MFFTDFKKVAAFAASFTVLHNAYAVDVNAGDYTALPAGTDVAALYYQHGESDGYYVNGDKIDAKSHSDIGILRLIHFTKIGNITIDPQILLPFGTVYNTRVGGQHLNDARGIADPIIGATFWLINQPQAGVSGRYVGLTPLIYLPVGQYNKHDSVNLGENRFKYDLQLGWVEPLYKNWSAEFYQDVIFYGNNDQAGNGSQTLKQHTSYQTQANLRYDFNPKQRVALGYSATYGGKQELDGVDQNTQTKTQQVRFEYQHMLNAKTQLSAQFTSDTQVESGFKKQLGANFRLLYLF